MLCTSTQMIAWMSYVEVSDKRGWRVVKQSVTLIDAVWRSKGVVITGTMLMKYLLAYVIMARFCAFVQY